MKDIEDALQRLDKLTQEEARMAAAEALTISRGIDDRVKDVDERLEGVDERVQRVDVKVEGIDGKVQGVDDKLLSVDRKVQDVDDNVLSVDSKVQDVDHKVGSVIEGELYHISWSPNLVLSPFVRLGVKETGVAIQQVANQVSNLNRS